MPEFYLELRDETERAFLFFDGDNKIWLPKSLIREMSPINGSDYEVIIPTWLAKQKDMI